MLFINSVRTLIGYSKDNPIRVAVYHTNKKITTDKTIITIKTIISKILTLFKDVPSYNSCIKTFSSK